MYRPAEFQKSIAIIDVAVDPDWATVEGILSWGENLRWGGRHHGLQ